MTGLLLAPDPGYVANPATGELIKVSEADTETLAELRSLYGLVYRGALNADAAIDDEIAARVERAVMAGEIAKRTVQIGDYSVSVESPAAAYRLDAGAYRLDLIRRARHGSLRLSEAAIDGMFRIEYHLVDSHYQALAKGDPQLAEIRLGHTEPRRQRVTVKRVRAAALDTTAEDDTPTLARGNSHER